MLTVSKILRPSNMLYKSQVDNIVVMAIRAGNRRLLKLTLGDLQKLNCDYSTAQECWIFS